ncbi:SCO7613 C-terminal domain-containing membrane protein [Bifidobacterium miconisargentati]|uniref:SCO7613 C-terminal domain-containing membrane protein n=1 Tax=Bifidobacterium miconisargentati TaxID=2834437 RepID=UPI001BDBD37A|nr:hypothetical protein [Bifidobacterium miconisargentati]MBW3089408.1 hypothetical protein [Bifidobacterium miconisargentati]
MTQPTNPQEHRTPDDSERQVPPASPPAAGTQTPTTSNAFIQSQSTTTAESPFRPEPREQQISQTAPPAMPGQPYPSYSDTPQPPNFAEVRPISPYSATPGAPMMTHTIGQEEQYPPFTNGLGVPIILPSAQPEPEQPRHSSVQILLLILGVALVTIAVLAFALVAYSTLGDIGRAAAIGCIGLLSLGIGVALTPRLRATAEGLAWAGLAALTIDAVLIGHIPVVALHVPQGTASGLIIVLVTAFALGLRFIHIPSHMPISNADSGSQTIQLVSVPAGSPAQNPSVRNVSTQHSPTSESSAPALSTQSNPVQGSAVPGSAAQPVLPLRAYTLYATFSLPFALILLMTDLPVVDSELRNTVAVAVGALVTALNAAFLKPSKYSRYADFEWVASAIVSMALLAPISFIMYPVMSSAEPFPLAASLCVLIPAAWAAILVTLHVRVLAHTGKTVHPLLCAIPTAGLVWTCASVSVPLSRGLEMVMANQDLARMCAYLATVLVAAIAMAAGCLLPRSGGFRRIGEPARTTASIIGAFLLMVLTFSEFDRRDVPAFITAMTAFILMLAVCTATGVLSAKPQSGEPEEAISKVNAPIPISTIELRPQPTSHVQVPHPQNAPSTYQHRYIYASALFAYCFAIFTAVVLMLWTLADHHPYISVDVIAIITGSAALIVGAYRLHVNAQARSWPVLWAPLTLLMVPSLLASQLEPVNFPRMLALLTISLVTLLLGALLGLQAPLIYGAVVLTIHILTVIWPWLAEFSRHYWWVWLLIGGIILIVTAARYEASLKSMRTIAARISDLR